MKLFYVHIKYNDSTPETVVPVTAANLDEAQAWADDMYTRFGIEVTRIRPKV